MASPLTGDPKTPLAPASIAALTATEHDQDNDQDDNGTAGSPIGADGKHRKSRRILTPAQLAKKRANDREAQRAIRERTKSQIETLEARVRDLESADAQQQLQAALRERDALQAENTEIKRRLAAAMELIRPLLGGGENTSNTDPLLLGDGPPHDPATSVLSSAGAAQVMQELAAGGSRRRSASERANAHFAGQAPAASMAPSSTNSNLVSRPMYPSQQGSSAESPQAYGRAHSSGISDFPQQQSAYPDPATLGQSRSQSFGAPEQLGVSPQQQYQQQQGSR